MAITVDKTRVPVNFEESGSQDSRFMKVKIWIAHTGENLNNSIFEKETFEKMLPTLEGIPIVGYIHKNEDDEDDFKGHEQEMVIMENGIKMRYKGHAYGFIPKEHNAQFEIRGGKEWITAEGIVWTKFNRAIDIFAETNGIKSQSMEITNVDGHVDDVGRLVITDATFDGLCILGEDNPPAMTGSTVEVFTVKDDLKKQFANQVDEMMTEFYQKGDSELEDNNNDLEEVVVADEEQPEDESVKDTEVEEEFEEAGQEETATPDPEGDVEDDKDPEPAKEDGEEESDEKPKDEEDEKDEQEDKSFGMLEFKLSLQEINKRLYSAIEGNLHSYIYIIETYSDEVLYEYVDYNEEGSESGFEKVKFTNDGEELVLSEPVRLYPQFLTAEEKQAVEMTRAMFEKLEDENKDLKEFKFNAEKEEKESVINRFSTRVSEDTLTKIRENMANFSIEEIEKDLAYEVFKAEGVQETAATSVTNFSNKGKDRMSSELGTLSIYAN